MERDNYCDFSQIEPLKINLKLIICSISVLFIYYIIQVSQKIGEAWHVFVVFIEKKKKLIIIKYFKVNQSETD